MPDYAAWTREELGTKIETLLDLLRRLLVKLPHEKHGAANGCCAGCSAIHWSPGAEGKEPCKPDCVLREAISRIQDSPSRADP